MKRQSKKQWCESWILSFGRFRYDGIVSDFYKFMGGKGPKPKVYKTEVMKDIVKKTMIFLERIK